jgi:tetratricopeptide (TPR) repeat protein
VDALASALPDTEPVPPPAPKGGRLARWVLAPFRYARRSPLRAVIVLLGLVAVVAGAGVASAAVWFDYHLRAATREVEKGHNAAATRHLRLCQWVRPEQRDVLLLAGRVSRRSGNWNEAEALLDKYTNRYGDDAPLVLERLLLRAARGDLEGSAAQLAERMRRDGPEAALSREAVVTGLQYRFRWAEANQLLDDWLGKTPDDTIALLLRGKLQEARQQSSEALLSFRRVLELDPEHDEARMRLTAMLLSQRQGEEALTHADYLRKRLPKHPEIRMQWVKALGLQGRAADARAALDACLRDFPTHPGALAERARYAALDGDDAAAEGYYEKAAKADPGNFPTRHQYSLALARNGKKAEADREQSALRTLEADSERINQLISGPLQSRPNDPAIHHEIGLIAMRSGQATEALRWFQTAVQVGPDHLPSHQTLAAYYHDAGSPVLAARHRAIAQNLSRRKPPLQ